MDIDLLITNAISNFKKGIDISNLLDEINSNDTELHKWWERKTLGRENPTPTAFHDLIQLTEQYDFFGDPGDINYNFEAMSMDLSDEQDILEYIRERFEQIEAGGISNWTLETIHFNDVYIGVDCRYEYDYCNYSNYSYSGFRILLTDNVSDWVSRDYFIIGKDKIESHSESDLVDIFKNYMSEYIKYRGMDIDSLITNAITNLKIGLAVDIALKKINYNNKLSRWCSNNFFKDNGEPSADYYRCVTKDEFFGDLPPEETILNDDQAIIKYIKQRTREIASSSKSNLTLIVRPYRGIYISIFREMNATISFNYDVEYSNFSLSISPDISELLYGDDILIKDHEVVNYADSELVALLKELHSK